MGILVVLIVCVASLGWVTQGMAAAAPAAGGGEGDFVFSWGERAYSMCIKDLKASKKERLLRGVCDTIQSLLENFLNYVAQKRGEWAGVAVSRELAPRLEEEYYRAKGTRGIQSTIDYALDKNIKERDKLGDHLDEWAQVWIRMATKLQSNRKGGQEILGADEVNARVEEFRRARLEEHQEDL